MAGGLGLQGCCCPRLQVQSLQFHSGDSADRERGSVELLLTGWDQTRATRSNQSPSIALGIRYWGTRDRGARAGLQGMRRGGYRLGAALECYSGATGLVPCHGAYIPRGMASPALVLWMQGGGAHPPSYRYGQVNSGQVRSAVRARLVLTPRYSSRAPCS
jgi:hypothetical protein